MIKTTIICGGGCGTTETLVRSGFYDRQKYPDDWYAVRALEHDLLNADGKTSEILSGGFVLVCPKCIMGFLVEQLDGPVVKLKNKFEVTVTIRKGDY